MRALLASASLLLLAVALYGDAARNMFAPQMVPEQTPYGYVSQAQLYGSMSTAHAQQLSNVQYGQPVAYAEPRVQLVAASQGGWGFSDLALLAVASGLVGMALGSQSKQSASAVEDCGVEDDDEEALATIAALAVGGETESDLAALAKDLNPVVGFYDPLKLSEGEFWGTTNEATIGFLRHAEIKHGRVAMAGFVGYLVHSNGIHFPWKVPGDELCGQVSAPELWYNLPYVAKVQIIVAIGIFEWWGELRLSGETEKHYMRGGKPGYFPSFDGLPHPVPFDL